MTTKVNFVADYKVDGIEHYATIQDVVQRLKEELVVSIDIETSRNPKIIKQYNEKVYKGGLDAYLSNIVMLQIGTQEVGFVIDVRDFTKKELQPIINFLNWNSKTTFVGHNIKFEGVHLKHKYGINLKKVYCTMTAEACLYNGISTKLSLLELSRKYLGIKETKSELSLFEDSINYEDITLDQNLIEQNEHLLTPFDLEENIEMDKSTRKQFITIGDKPFTYEQISYGYDDILYPLLIRERQLLGHTLYSEKPYRPLNNLRLESKFTQVAAEMELNGLPFNKEIWVDLYEKNKIIYEKRKRILDKWVFDNEPEYIQTDLFNPYGKVMIDWSSPKQVIDFFKKQGVEIKERSKQTKKMELTVSASALLATLPNKLKDLYQKDKWADIVDIETLKLAYLLVRKSSMNITSFGLSFLENIHPITGRIHCNYRTHLNTARTATTKPNLLAIPPSHRIAFTTKHLKGKKLVVNDYNSQESRVLASMSEDPILLKFFNEGDPFFGSDFHSYTSDKIHKTRNPDSNLIIVPKEDPKTGEKHLDFTEEMATMRQGAKTISFAIPYGSSSLSVAKKLGISIEEAEELMDDYLTTFEGVDTYLRNRKEEALENGYFEMDTKLHSMYFYPDFKKLKEMEQEIKDIFFTDEYRDLSKPEREQFKKELYKEKPYLKENMSYIGMMKTSLQNKGCNYSIQGLSAKQSKMSLVRIREWKIENNLEEWLSCLLQHDELLSEAPDEITDIVLEKQSYFMKDSAEWFCPNVKFETSGGIFEDWEH